MCTALALMHTYESAAGYANIALSTLSYWRNQGRAAREKQERGEPLDKKEARHLQFLEAVEQAEAEAVFSLHQVVIEGAKHDPRLALQMLQIRRPNDYAPPAVRQEITGPQGGSVKAEVEHRGQVHGSVEHVAAVVAALAGVGAIQLAGVSGGGDAEDDAVHPA